MLRAPVERRQIALQAKGEQIREQDARVAKGHRVTGFAHSEPGGDAGRLEGRDRHHESEYTSNLFGIRTNK